MAPAPAGPGLAAGFGAAVDFGLVDAFAAAGLAAGLAVAAGLAFVFVFGLATVAGLAAGFAAGLDGVALRAVALGVAAGFGVTAGFGAGAVAAGGSAGFGGALVAAGSTGAAAVGGAGRAGAATGAGITGAAGALAGFGTAPSAIRRKPRASAANPAPTRPASAAIIRAADAAERARPPPERRSARAARSAASVPPPRAAAPDALPGSSALAGTGPSQAAISELRKLTQPSGITTSVSSVDTSPPNISEIAMPWKIGSDRITDEPTISAIAVMMIGRVRVWQAWITASCTRTPFSTACSEKSTSRIELRTMIPASAMKPIIEVAVNEAPNSQCPGTIPISVSGIGAMTIAGRVKLPNSQTTRI